MGFHVNNTGFISGDGQRRYSPSNPGASTGMVDNANSAAPLKARGLVDRVRAQRQEQDSKAKQPKTNERHDNQPLTVRGLTK